MIFRQLFDSVSSTYSYLLASRRGGEALIIDPVLEKVDRYLQLVNELDLKLVKAVDTHIHADHITAALHLKQQVGSRIAAPAMERLPCTDLDVLDGVPFAVGGLAFRPMHTPGHTDGHFAYALDDRVFTGDALLIDGCGRTDFQNGDAGALYASVTGKLFALADECLVYPGHDYQNRRVSSIGQEKLRNPRLGGGKSREEFERIMASLDLPYPKFIDFAVPGNRQCGVCPDDVPEQMKAYCGRMTESRQG
jgi:glyoxylase-like metal-dependent hydrolase (beta-lactamase superfamily II)